MKTNLADGFYAAFDLGAHSVKALLIERRDGKERMTALEEELLKPPSDFPGENEFRDHQINQLKQLTERLPMKEVREAVAVLNSRELQVKVVEPPSQVQPDKLPEVLHWEAKKLLSPTYRNEPFLVAYRIIRESPPVALIAVIPQSVLARFQDLFKAAGIELTGGYADVFGCMAIKDGIQTTGMPALSIINLGHTGTHLQIFSAGELKFYRFIPSGCSEFSTPPQPNELDVFSQKIRFSFDYFRAITKLGHIDEILFMGGGGALQEYVNFAKDYFAPGKIESLDVSQKIDVSPVLSQVAQLPGPHIKHARLMPFLPALGAYWAHRDAVGRPTGSQECNLLGCFQALLWKERMDRFSNKLPLWIAISGVLILTVILGLWRVSLVDQREQMHGNAGNSSINVATLEAKISRLLSSRAPEIRLSPRDKSALTPLLHDRLGCDEILFLIDQQKPAGLKLQKIAIQSLSQSENEGSEGESESEPEPEPASRPADNQGTPASPDSSFPEPPPPPPVPMGGAMGGADNAQNIEDLGGEILVLKGTAVGYEPLVALAESLTKSKVLRRYRIVKVVAKGTQELRFTLKGELQ